MRVVSPLLKHAVFPGLAKLGYLRRRNGAGPAIVTYHGIFPQGYKMIDPDLDGSLVSADSFRRQLRLLKDHYNVISPQQFLDWCEAKQDLPARAVLLTCDDDLRNTLTDMVPILQEHGLSCLFFVTGASLGAVPAMLWYEQLYLMVLSVREDIALDLATDFRRDRGPCRTNGECGGALVKHLSRFDAAERQARVDEVQAQLRLSDDWSTQVLSGPLRRRFLMLNADGSAIAGGRGNGSGRAYPDPPAAVATASRSRVGRDRREPRPPRAGDWPGRYGRWPIPSGTKLPPPSGSGKWQSAPDSAAPS